MIKPQDYRPAQSNVDQRKFDNSSVIPVNDSSRVINPNNISSPYPIQQKVVIEYKPN